MHSFDVCYAYAGSGILRVNGAEHPVRAGDIFVAQPGQVHEIESDHDDPMGIYFWGHTLIPDRPVGAPDAIDQLLEAFTARGAPAVAAATSLLEPVVSLLAAEAARLAADSAAIVGGQAIALVVHTARAIAGTTIRHHHPAHPAARSNCDRADRDRADRDRLIVRMIERCLRDKCRAAHRLRDLAAQVHLSERHTSRSGTSPPPSGDAPASLRRSSATRRHLPHRPTRSLWTSRHSGRLDAVPTRPTGTAQD